MGNNNSQWTSDNPPPAGAPIGFLSRSMFLLAKKFFSSGPIVSGMI